MIGYIAVINGVAILAAAVVNIVIGTIWYSPFLFGNLWMKLVGKSEKDMEGMKKEMIKVHVIMLIAAIVFSFVLALFIGIAQAKTVVEGATVGLWVWVGFVATTVLPVYLFEGRPKKLYLLYVAYQLVASVIMGAVLVSLA